MGRVGVAIDSLADMELLFDGIPLDKVSTNFTINTTSAPILAMYMAVGPNRAYPRHSSGARCRMIPSKNTSRVAPGCFRWTRRCG